MATIQTVALPWSTVLVKSSNTTPVFVPATPWLPASAVQSVRATWEFLNRTDANFQIRPAYEVANTVDDTSTTVGGIGSLDDPGVHVPSGGFTDVSSNTQGKQLIRFGWQGQYDNVSSALCAGFVGGSIQIVMAD